MIEKRADYSLIDVQPLNKPVFSASFIKDQNLKIDEEIVKQTIDKIASSAKEATEDKDGDSGTLFDLEAEISSHPDSLFIKCFAIKADETNDNGDFFSHDELIKATPTFVGVPLFTNHANSDINEARGKVVHSWWDNEKNGIMIIGRVDASAYPQLARGIKEDYVGSTSMGCQVQHSLCSICHNYAETPDDYCGCIRERKTRQVVSRNQECGYHKNGNEDLCPLCSCKKGETKKYAVKSQVFEYNYGIKFIENSFVVNPACHDCGVTEVIDPSALLSKIASLKDRAIQLKEAAGKEFCTDIQCVKVAGQDEINSLNEALDLISSVSQAMLNQKEQIDLEFLSDLVKVLADLQTVTDELSEQGYGRLQSPGQTAPMDDAMGTNPPMGGPEEQMQPMNPTPGGGSKIHSGPAGQAGTVTSPIANKRNINLEKISAQILKQQKFLSLPPFELKEMQKKQIKSVSKKIDINIKI